MPKFTVNAIPNLKGKTAIVTGSSSGIGRITATELARKECRVVLACRSEEKTLPILEAMKKETKNDEIEFMELDLTSLESIAAFSKNFLSKYDRLDLLINNAGVMATPFQLTKDGIEMQFGTNHLGHFALTNHLLELIEKSAPSRIVNLSSSLHAKPYPTGVRLDLINDQKSYDPWKAYGQSKLCNILFTKELANRLADKKVYVNAVHPGYVATDLQRNLGDLYGAPGRLFGYIGYKTFAMSPEKGALTSLYVGTSPEIEEKDVRGQFFVPIAKHSTPSAFAQDDAMAKKLWEYSENLLKEKASQ